MESLFKNLKMDSLIVEEISKLSVGSNENNCDGRSGWEEFFSRNLSVIDKISEKIAVFERTNQIVPDKDKIFRAFELCPFDKVKVVIFGQDPYQSLNKSGEPIAQGLAFSVKDGEKIPPSLRNIIKEIKNEYPNCHMSSSGSLESWAKQGVLLLNISLTTNMGKSDAHKKVWDSFIINVMKELSDKKPNCIYLLWGNNAKAMQKHITKGYILTAAHPSPLSANKGFFGCDHFIETNKILQENNESEIDWCI